MIMKALFWAWHENANITLNTKEYTKNVIKILKKELETFNVHKQ